MARIYTYKLLTDFTADNSGFSQWAFAEKDGVPLFLKRFLSPVYPIHKDLYDIVEFRNRQAYCDAFVEGKQHLYAALRECHSIAVVPILDFFLFEGKYYVVTEKVDALDISVDDIVVLSERKKLDLMHFIVGGIDELHHHGIIHADLKPSNLLFRKDASGALCVKIIDYDSSFLQGSTISIQDIEGDPVYLAPETYLALGGRKSELTDKVDVFALGVIFYQYMFGEYPVFQGNPSLYPFESVLAGEALSFPEGIPEDVKKLFCGMLQREPKKRWDTKKVLSRLEKLRKRMR